MFFVAFFSLLISTPQTIHPTISSKAIFPASTVLTVASGIATAYYYKQEKDLLLELERLSETAAAIENSVIETTPSEIAALKEIIEQKRTGFQKRKWIFGGATLLSLLTAVISGVKSRQHSEQPTSVDSQEKTKLLKETTDLLEQIAAAMNTTSKTIVQTIRTLLVDLEPLSKQVQEKTSTLNNELPEEITGLLGTNTKKTALLKQIAYSLSAGTEPTETEPTGKTDD